MPRTIDKPELVLARLVAALRKLDKIVEDDPQIPDVVIDLADAAENFEDALYNSPSGSKIREIAFHTTLLFSEHDLM